MRRVNCTASTKKPEVVTFCNKNAGETIVLHYEHNMYDTFCDDEIEEITLDREGMAYAIKVIRDHYIHGAWVKED